MVVVPSVSRPKPMQASKNAQQVKNRAVVFKEYLDHLREGTEVTA